jgi:hypothetical protein
LLGLVVVLTGLLALASSAYEPQEYHGRDYQQQNASAKLSQLWSAVTADTTSNPWPSALEEVELFFESMNLTFSYDWDQFMPNEIKVWPYKTGYTRTKLAHAQGSVAMVEWVSNGLHNYTGLFQGARSGLIRLSLGGPPTVDPANPAMVPGFGLKFLRSGLSATNLFGLYALGGQPSFNFFEHDLTNHVPDLGTDASYVLRKVRDIFAQASAWPTMLGVSDFASYTQYGAAVPQPNFPYRLVFHPALPYHEKFANLTPTTEVLGMVAQALVPGSVLYHIYAQPSPYASDVVPIGQLVLRSRGYTSMFGDKTMFMQHVAMENDLALRPDWAEGALAIVKAQQSQIQFYFPDLPWQ